MLFSYKELSRLVCLDNIKVEQLRDRLTFSGFEVEDLYSLAQASKLVIGKILTCVNHPDSDHLHLLTVDCGNEGIKNIVCGAKNARVGIKVIVALEGCELPFLHETIKKGSIRGQVSEGMCCSLLELGVNKESLPSTSPSLDGIEELDENAPIGERNVLEYLDLDDYILDINVLPNRPDCLSYIGMAREISSLFNVEFKPLKEIDLSCFKEEVKAISLTCYCPRIDILKIDNIKVKDETPLYIKRVLQANGIRPISPIVDLGNYSMLLTGQPLNMYDNSKNESNSYTVRSDYEGEFVTFDNKKLDLVKDDIVIFDNDKPICLAGIMAGVNQSITNETKSIAIEAASFYHANIRHTSSRLGLSSPSSILFGKGRNPMMIDEAIKVTISLLDEFLSSYTITSYSSYNTAKKENKPFSFSIESLNKRLGSNYTSQEVDEVLKAYRIKKLDSSTLLAPIDRVDLNEQCDIEEEVFRYYSADKIPHSLINFPLTHGKLSYEQKMKREIRELLVNKGLYEIISFTLISEKDEESIHVFNNGEPYRILNPMTKDHEIVRSDLLPSMIMTMEYNLAHQNKNLALFEISHVDTKKGEKTYLSIGLTGNCSLAEFYQTREYTFFDLKGLVEAIFIKLGINGSRYRLAYSKNEKFHPNCSADIFIGKDLVGTFGKLHPSFKKDMFVCELDLGYLFSMKGMKSKYSHFSSLPTVRRDLSFKMRDSVSYFDIKKVILHTSDCYVKDVLFFDDFVDKFTHDHYIGVSLILSKEDSTLKDSEINDSINKVINNVKSSLGITLRG